MSKIYRLIIISIMAVIFAIGCSDTNSQSSGGGNITDNGSSGGNGGDGSGGDGSGSSSEIINSTMRASASEDNALLYTFFTPAAATNGASLKYSWDFDDNAEETTDTNIINHEFSKYGKSYNVTLEVSNMQTNDKENVSMIIPLPKPTIYFACSSAGLDIYCLPNISQQGIMDVEYTWNIYNSSEEQIASLNTTGSHELATYTLPVSGTYKIELIGRSEKVDGDLTYTENIEVSQSLNKGSISHSVLSADKLQYKLRYSAGSTNGEVLNYCWEIDEEVGSGKCESDANYHQGTSSTYDEIMHTFPKYKKAYNIKGYVKDASGENPAVSSAIIYQDLPVVAVSATGAGLSKKFSPVFTYKPAGNLQYIWSFGDGAQSSAENPEHTYQKSGYYTVNLEIISDKFDTSIGSIKSDDVNININEHITNVVIETSLKARDKSGEKYIISSPAESTNGALYYIWKIDGAVVSEGENIHTLEHSFPIYGKSYSVSLEVEDKTTGTKVIAEPKVVTTKKPIAKIVLPPYSTPNTQVQIQAKLYFEDTGEDFVLIADNPAYEWYIDGKNENNNNHLIVKTFATTQQVPLELYFRANNIEGNIVKAESILYVNELNLECSITDDAEDMYGAIVSCQIPTDIDGATSYYYKYTYTEYMNGVPVVVEVPATEKSTFKIKLYAEGSPKRYPEREINLQWYAGLKGQYQYTGNNKLLYKAKEPVINRIAKIYEVETSINSPKAVFIQLDTGELLIPYSMYNEKEDRIVESFRYLYAFKNDIVKNINFVKIGIDNDGQYIFFQTESGTIYKMKLISNYTINSFWDEEKELEIVQGVSGTILNVTANDKTIRIITDNGIYKLDYYGNGEKIFDGAIKYYYDGLVLLEDGSVYIASYDGNYLPILQDKKISMLFGGLGIVVTENGELYKINVIYSNEEGKYVYKATKIELEDGKQFQNRIELVYSGIILIDDKAYEEIGETGNGRIELMANLSHLSINKMVCKRDEKGYANCWIATNDEKLYVFGNNANGVLGLGHSNPVTTPEQMLKSEKIKNINHVTNSSSPYEKYGKGLIVETSNATYEWDYTSETGQYINTPQKAKESYNVIDIKNSTYATTYTILTTIGLFYQTFQDYSVRTHLCTDLPLDPVAKNNKIYSLTYGLSYSNGDVLTPPYTEFVLINGKLYGINSTTGKSQLFDKAFFDQQSLSAN